MQCTCNELARKLKLSWIEADVVLKLLKRQGKATIVSLQPSKRGRPSVVWEVPSKIILEFELE